MKRSKAERRHDDWRIIQKREKEIKNFKKHDKDYDADFADQRHRLSKNKVEVPECSTKSRGEYKISDLKKLEALQYSVEEADVNLNMTPRRGW